MPASGKSFIQLVEAHERDWGRKQYNGRPSLSQILQAKVVVFWRHTEKDMPPTITLHQSLVEIEKVYHRMLLATDNDSKRRISVVFEDQSRVRIKAIRIVFDKVDE